MKQEKVCGGGGIDVKKKAEAEVEVVEAEKEKTQKQQQALVCLVALPVVEDNVVTGRRDLVVLVINCVL